MLRDETESISHLERVSERRNTKRDPVTSNLTALIRGIDTHVRDTLRQSAPVEAYVKSTWIKLQRRLRDIYLGGCIDPKMPKPADNRYFLYVGEKQEIEPVKAELEKARKAAMRKIRAGSAVEPEGGLPIIEVRKLPPKEQWGNIPLAEHGLLYIPHPYIVPGVRFNEMYNWDSMFVVRGLLESKRFDAAKHLTDNLLYEQNHYGTILNANRTYYLDSSKSRSQPPLITAKVLDIFDNWEKLKHAKGESAVAWLTHAANTIEEYSKHWLTAPHFHEKSGLSLYSSNKKGPSSEVTHGERGHYEGALEMLTAMYRRQKLIGDDKPLSYQDRKDRYYLEQYLTVSRDEKTFSLSEKFYQGDAAMRESGFDPSHRFGIYNVDIINHLPVCLNSLRLKMENEMTEIYARLEQCDTKRRKEWHGKKEAWKAKAAATKKQINSWLWDDGLDEHKRQVRKPCYRDRNINTKLCRKHNIPEFRDYDFATALFPLWAGAADQEQAEKVIAHILPALHTKFGLNTSGRVTGCQWDKPIMWAPLQVVAVEALERYGHYYEALDIALNFLKTISKDFGVTGKLWEKYESEYGTSNIAPYIKKGYFVNDEGFAWTNAAVLELRQAVRRLQKKVHHKILGEPDEIIIHRPVKQEGGPAAEAVIPIPPILQLLNQLARNGHNNGMDVPPR